MAHEVQQGSVSKSQQTSTPTPVNNIPNQAVQRPTRPPKQSKTTTKGKGKSGHLDPSGGVRKRTKTQFQEDIKGIGKRTSPVWQEFTIVPEKDENGDPISLHAVCRHCNNTDYRAEGRYGTSNCIKHLKTCQPYQDWVSKNGDPIGTFNQRKYCSLFAEAIIYHGYPLGMVEHEFTRRLHRFLNPNVQNISRTTITR